MKRSQAVARIKQVIDAMGPGPSSERVASEILRSLEHAGMKPPITANPRYDADVAFQYAQHPFLEYEEKREVNEWEKE